MLQNIAVQWLFRRIPEWGGIVAVIMGAIVLAPADVGDSIRSILSGQGGGLTLTAYIGLVSWVYAQVISFRATVKPQAIIMEDGKLVTNTLSPAKEREVTEAVKNVSSKKTILDLLLGR